MNKNKIIKISLIAFLIMMPTVIKAIGDLANKTTVNEYKQSLKYFYGTLDSPEDYLFSTNSFNCNETSCSENDLTDVGVLTEYEYNKIGGIDSYINPYISFYINSNGTIKELTNSGVKADGGTSGLRPTTYLKEDTVVIGTGTSDDPYIISDMSDLNFEGFTLNGQQTGMQYDYLLENNVVRDVTCKKGTPATWDYDTNSININPKEVIYGDYCTINFKDGFVVSLSAGTTGVVSAPVSKTSKYNGTLTFKVTPNPGYTNKLEENTCAGTLNGDVLTISGIKDNKICEIKFKKETYTLTLDANGGYFGNPTEIDDGFDDAVALTKGTSYPLATGRTLSLKRNTKYMLTYDYKSDSTNIMFNTVLFPDTLPEIYPTAKTEWQTMNWVFSSSSSSMTSATIRYFNDRTVPNSDNIYIVNKHLYECADCTTTSSKSIEYNGKYETLPTPKRNEWKFLGWYTTSGVKVDENTSIDGNSNQKLIAKWEKITYELKLNAVNGKVANSPIWYWFGGWESSGATLTPNEAYTSEGATVTCNGGAVAVISNGVVYFRKVNKSQTCTITFKQMTLLSKVLSDNPTISTRTTFSTPFTTNTAKTLYKSTENGTNVYYFAGQDTESTPINNWVKFGKYGSNDLVRGYANSTTTAGYSEYSSMEECKAATSYNYNCTLIWKAGGDIYWRIIKTNSDGSLKLLYSGNSPDTETGIINTGGYNGVKGPRRAGYMYGNTDSTLEEARTNTKESSMKFRVDLWYNNNLTPYTNYLSNDAVYCNDRELATENIYSTSSRFYFKSNERLDSSNGVNSKPTYDCSNKKDAFSVNNTEAKLKYPIALMTADEIWFAGGFRRTAAPIWYRTNSKYNIITGEFSWHTLTPNIFTNNNVDFWVVNYMGGLAPYEYGDTSYGIRPVISLKNCVLYKSGNGSATSPYEIEMNGGC